MTDATVEPAIVATPPLDLVYGRALRVLRAGFRLTAVLLVAGIVVAIARGEELKEKADPFAKIVPALLDGHSSGVIDLAILAIMTTPVVTVVVIAVTFRQLGERRFFTYSLAVIAILAASIASSLIR